MDELELAQAEAEFVHAGLAQHRADRKRGSSLLVPRLQFNRCHTPLGFQTQSISSTGPKSKDCKNHSHKKGCQKSSGQVQGWPEGHRATHQARKGRAEGKAVRSEGKCSDDCHWLRLLRSGHCYCCFENGRPRALHGVLV